MWQVRVPVAYLPLACCVKHQNKNECKINLAIKIIKENLQVFRLFFKCFFSNVVSQLFVHHRVIWMNCWSPVFVQVSLK